MNVRFAERGFFDQKFKIKIKSKANDKIQGNSLKKYKKCTLNALQKPSMNFRNKQKKRSFQSPSST